MSTEAPSIQPNDVEVGMRDLWRNRTSLPVRVPNAEKMAEAIQAVAAPALADVERTIEELTAVRDMLRDEAERVQREIAAYQSLSQAASTSMKIITDSLAQWKRARQGSI